MFAWKKPNEDEMLQKAIDKVHSEMADESSDSEEYAKMADQLTKLYALKPEPMRINSEALIYIIGQTIGIMLIVRYEKEHVLTSKALSLIQRFK